MNVDPLRAENHARVSMIEQIMHLVAPRHGLTFRRALERMDYSRLSELHTSLLPEETATQHDGAIRPTVESTPATTHAT